MAKTHAKPGDIARVELTKRGQWDTKTKACTLCAGTPESHIDPALGRFRGCGAAKRLNLEGEPWNRAGEYTLVIEDFPKRAIRSEQERIAYAIVKSLAKAGKSITSASVSGTNPTWSPRDSYRLLQALAFRGILNRLGDDPASVPEEVDDLPDAGAAPAPTT